jgi:hypothetical protein
MDKKTEEFYDRLKVELDNSNTWPALYLFKFIVPSEADNVARVELVLIVWVLLLKRQNLKQGSSLVYQLMFRSKILKK